MDELNKGSFENELVNKSLLIMKTKDMCTQTKKKVQIGFDELFNDLIPIIKNSLYCCGL